MRRNLRGETQLHVACIKGNFKMAKKLIDEGHPVNERDNLNWLPIHEASNYGFTDIVDLLIKHGAKINDSISPITPLHDASQNGHFQVVKLLLKAGALTYVFSKEGYTPLDFLVKYKEDNEKDLSGSDLALYKELHDYMLKSIRSKDKMYKVKRVVGGEENYIALENEADNDYDHNDDQDQDGFAGRNKENSVSKRAEKMERKKADKMNDLLYFDDEDESNKASCSEKEGGKKKKAVNEYKYAMSGIGSKSTTTSGGGFNLIS